MYVYMRIYLHTFNTYFDVDICMYKCVVVPNAGSCIGLFVSSYKQDQNGINETPSYLSRSIPAWYTQRIINEEENGRTLLSNKLTGWLTLYDLAIHSLTQYKAKVITKQEEWPIVLWRKHTSQEALREHTAKPT